MKRPVQLSLNGDRDRPVTTPPLSVVPGTNAELIAAVAPLYLTGSVLDVTYGEGNWWRRFRPENFVCHDLAIDGVDFRQLPEKDRSFESVCFDPPYVPRHGKNLAPGRALNRYRERFGLDVSRTSGELWELIETGLKECARVSRRWVLAKCCDYVNGRRFEMGSVRMVELGRGVGLKLHDCIVLTGHPGPGAGGETVLRCRRAHSYLVVFKVPLTHLSGRLEGGL